MSCWRTARGLAPCGDECHMGVRQAKPCDLAACLRINAAGFVGDDPFDAAWLVERTALPGTLLLVDDAGAGVIRGFVLTQRYATGTKLLIIATDPQFRRQGVGRRMLGRVKAPAGAWVRKENEASRAMFTKAGWHEEFSGWQEADKPSQHTGEWCYYTLGRDDGKEA